MPIPRLAYIPSSNSIAALGTMRSLFAFNLMPSPVSSVSLSMRFSYFSPFDTLVEMLEDGWNLDPVVVYIQ